MYMPRGAVHLTSTATAGSALGGSAAPALKPSVHLTVALPVDFQTKQIALGLDPSHGQQAGFLLDALQRAAAERDAASLDARRSMRLPMLSDSALKATLREELLDLVERVVDDPRYVASSRAALEHGLRVATSHGEQGPLDALVEDNLLPSALSPAVIGG
uniref:Uncharacterized protein n=2 Tax=Haptolina ericina TaxID=156174 RepID=A0A7S3EV97_9EUKA